MLHIPFKNQYVNLDSSFYTSTIPSPVAKPGLIQFNTDLGESLGIRSIHASDDDIAACFSGNKIPDGAEPLAMAYAGHQFGSFNPQLGDGRAILLGEVVNSQGITFDLQLKGSGPTVYSRNGDGRAALGPVLREYLVSEAMYQLGVPTTRALAAVTTGEQVIRESLLPGGVITRVARSFIRVGTFEYFAARGDLKAVQQLADFVIQRSYPQLRDSEHPYASLLRTVVDGQASLIARWMQYGFIHGVMNTDNMSIACETIDYGPCAFMDGYDHNKVYSYIDQQGRYAYSNQPPIGLWNLTRLAETLVPLMDADQDRAINIAKDILISYQNTYELHWLANMRAKCGLSSDVDSSIANGDRRLIESLFNIMHERRADFTLTFYYLSQFKKHEKELRGLFKDSEKWHDWTEQWQQRLSHESQTHDMQKVNPVYIPRNHQIEAAIRAAEDHNDFSVFYDLLKVLQNPYEEQAGKENYMLPPCADEIVHQTFCGT